MKIAELRNLSKEDLTEKLSSLKEELGKINYAKTIGQVDKPHRFKETRRTIARIKTILKETENKKGK